MEEFVLVDEDWVRVKLSNLHIRKSMGLDGMHLQVVRELTEAINRPLSTIWSVVGKRRGACQVEEHKCQPSLHKRARRRTLITIGQSVSPLSFKRCWCNLFLVLSLCTSRAKRTLGADSMVLPKGSCA